MATSDISAAFPFESKHVEVLGSKMHYINEGSGDLILFLHGQPNGHPEASVPCDAWNHHPT